MKKILSTLLAMAMLLSVVVAAAVPTSAADGQWTVYADPAEYGPDSNGEEQHPYLWGY